MLMLRRTYFFFFQAEDGIRDLTVTGVQTCALPIWTRFAADPQIIGKTLNLNNYNMTVVGVAQAGFDGVELGRSPKIFIPIMMQAQIVVGNPEDMLKERRNRWVNAFGRLKPGVSQQQAKAALQPFMHSMLEMEEIGRAHV